MITLKNYKNTLLLIIIYLSFISLGLPDSLLGAAWPTIQDEFNVPLSYAGIISMIISGGTILSSLFSDQIIKKFGTGPTTAISVAMTAFAIGGFALSDNFLKLCVFAIPYGLGAGAVDAALNNYVAINYSSKHMSWLHAFWGIGVTISPYIMSISLNKNLGWNNGYKIVSIIQSVLVLFIVFSLSLWRKNSTDISANDKQTEKGLSLKNTILLKGAPEILTAFFCYCALETTTGLWASSYLVQYKNINLQTAAKFTSLFYIGITAGRILNGFFADKFGDKKMIRIGGIIIITGVIAVGLPVNSLSLAGLVIIGLGAAPVYPCIIHSTPQNFGEKNSQSLIGIQMASAYLGTTLMPPLFGLIAQHINIKLYPLYLLILAAFMLYLTEKLNRKIKNQQ